MKRVIPVLTLDGDRLVKTVKFGKKTYIGDPVNTLRIFNKKEVDEIVLLDISATAKNRTPDFVLLEKIAAEAFMPLSYGGGVDNIDNAKRIIKIGFEKISINTAALQNSDFVERLVGELGSQSVVVSIDVKKNIFGKNKIYSKTATVNKELFKFVEELNKIGIGEIFLNSVDRDGTMSGYDFELLSSVTKISDMPVVICGGASGEDDIKVAFEYGAAAAAAGSMFVFYGPHRAVLISYINRELIGF